VTVKTRKNQTRIRKKNQTKNKETATGEDLLMTMTMVPLVLHLQGMDLEWERHPLRAVVIIRLHQMKPVIEIFRSLLLPCLGRHRC
jgi:hypothetical protein